MDLLDDGVTDVFGDGADTLVDGGGKDGGRGIRGPRYGSGAENAVENGSDVAESSPLEDRAPATADDISDRTNGTPSLSRHDWDARGDGRERTGRSCWGRTH